MSYSNLTGPNKPLNTKAKYSSETLSAQETWAPSHGGFEDYRDDVTAHYQDNVTVYYREDVTVYYIDDVTVHTEMMAADKRNEAADTDCFPEQEI